MASGFLSISTDVGRAVEGLPGRKIICACPLAVNVHSAYQAHLTIAHGAAQPGGGDLCVLTAGWRRNPSPLEYGIV